MTDELSALNMIALRSMFASSDTRFAVARAMRKIVFKNKSSIDAVLMLNLSVSRRHRTDVKDHDGTNFLLVGLDKNCARDSSENSESLVEISKPYFRGRVSAPRYTNAVLAEKLRESERCSKNCNTTDLVIMPILLSLSHCWKLIQQCWYCLVVEVRCALIRLSAMFSVNLIVRIFFKN